MRFACDTGGTFTDLIVEDDDGALSMYKASTTPADPVKGVLDALALAAEDREMPLADMLARGDMLIHGTTHAINAIITGNTARTAFLTTTGHPDVLVLREGGRIEPFNFVAAYPEPYIPRAHLRSARTDQQRRIGVHPARRGGRSRDHRQVSRCGGRGRRRLFPLVDLNPAHELRVGEMLEEHLPGVPYTLSHRINPALREYRRASATAIDASLKPLMGKYLGGLTERLSAAGFDGRTLVLTSQGACSMPGTSRRSRSTPSTPARRWRRSPAATMPGSIPMRRT